MAFPTILKRQLFSHFTERADKHGCCPSMRMIAKLARLPDEEAATRILRDMQSDGVIKILRLGEYPWVSVLRHSYNGPLVEGRMLDPERFGERSLPVTAAAPVPVQAAPIQTPVYVPIAPVVKTPIFSRPVAPVDQQPKSRMTAIPTMRPVVRPERTPGPVAPILSEPVAIIPRSFPEPFPKKAAARAKRLAATVAKPIVDPTKFACGHDRTPENSTRNNTSMRCKACLAASQKVYSAKRRAEQGKPLRAVGSKRAIERAKRADTRVNSVTVDMSADLRDKMLAVAKERGTTIGVVIAERCNAPVAVARPKTRIPAAVMRAYLNDGRPFDQFMTAMLELGVESLVAFKAAA